MLSFRRQYKQTFSADCKKKMKLGERTFSHIEQMLK